MLAYLHDVFLVINIKALIIKIAAPITKNDHYSSLIYPQRFPFSSRLLREQLSLLSIFQRAIHQQESRDPNNFEVILGSTFHRSGFEKTF